MAYLHGRLRGFCICSLIRYSNFMRHFLLVIALLVLASIANAREYGVYDAQKLLVVDETVAGKRYGFDGAYLDLILDDLAAHAMNYPPRFDTPQDRQRAERDAKMLSGMLDVMVDVPSPDPELLLSAARLNALGHNLHIPGAAQKANALFQRFLAAVPSDPRGNYLYGHFLASAGQAKLALPYLEQALALGVDDAAYTMGMSYLSVGDKDSALKYLEDYRRRQPGNGNVDKLIDGIRNATIEIKKTNH